MIVEVEYSSDVNISLDKEDLEEILAGGAISKNVIIPSYNRELEINIIPSDTNFYCKSDFGDNADPYFFQGCRVDKLREKPQIILPFRGGRIRGEDDYGYLDVIISRPALIEIISNRKYDQKSNNQFYGILKGTDVGHEIDKITIYF